VLPHASCLVRANKAYLFCGPSGSGKTTVARLSHEATVLTDELPVVRVVNGRAIAYGTPFWGQLARGAENRSAPLAGIYFLRQAQRHAVRPVGLRPALEQLLANVLFFAREGGLPAQVFGIAADLIEAVPCFQLFFRPDPGFWEAIDDV
jgi:energy-coupling factor transporter ATP-binding protein EcfA2